MCCELIIKQSFVSRIGVWSTFLAHSLLGKKKFEWVVRLSPNVLINPFDMSLMVRNKFVMGILFLTVMRNGKHE